MADDLFTIQLHVIRQIVKPDEWETLRKIAGILETRMHEPWLYKTPFNQHLKRLSSESFRLVVSEVAREEASPG